jgi:hypothetical protein
MLFHISEHNAWLPFRLIEASSKEEATATLRIHVAKQSWEKIVWLTASMRQCLDHIDETPVPSIELINTLTKMEEELRRIARQHHIVVQQEENGA